jgi:hypothetical protein
MCAAEPTAIYRARIFFFKAMGSQIPRLTDDPIHSLAG